MRSNEDVAARTLTFVLAGGEGRRLIPLTKYRPKPLVPFGGCYRIVDFTLSNCLNSGLKRVYVLTQHEGESVDAYLRKGWSRIGPGHREFVFPARRPAENATRELPTLFYRTCFSWSSIGVSSRSFSPGITFTGWIIATFSASMLRVEPTRRLPPSIIHGSYQPK